VNRRELEEYLREQGCQFDHHGGRHDIWLNPTNNKTAPVPRHKTIPKGTVRSICRQLDVPRPPNL
jgi:mRNA interferase HicA